MLPPEFENPNEGPTPICPVCWDFMVVLEKPINFDSEGWTEPLTDVEEISRAEKAGKLVMATFYLCASCGLAVIDDEYTDALEQM